MTRQEIDNASTKIEQYAREFTIKMANAVTSSTSLWISSVLMLVALALLYIKQRRRMMDKKELYHMFLICVATFSVGMGFGVFV